MSMTIKELLVVAKETLVTEKEISDLKERLKNQEKEFDSSKITKEFLDRTYSI